MQEQDPMNLEPPLAGTVQGLSLTMRSPSGARPPHRVGGPADIGGLTGGEGA